MPFFPKNILAGFCPTGGGRLRRAGSVGEVDLLPGKKPRSYNLRVNANVVSNFDV